jgi:RNA polymerase sigma factor (sigma-70 family)
MVRFTALVAVCLPTSGAQLRERPRDLFVKRGEMLRHSEGAKTHKDLPSLAQSRTIPEMNQNPPELEDLIERCRRGEETAWIDLVHQFNQPVAHWLARLDYTLRPPDIEDLGQEVFKKVIHTLPGYRAEVPFRSWLYRQTESIAIDGLRKRSAAKRKAPGEVVSLHSGATEAGLSVDPLDQSPRPDELAASRDDHRLLFEAMNTLGPPESRCRQLIGLCYFGGFKYDEVAQTLDMNAHTVSSALSKCLAELREIAAKIFSRSNPARPATGTSEG